MKKLMITVACAVTASVLSAQEMGATVTETAAGAADQGAEIAAQADAQAAQLAAEAPSEEFVSAEEVVNKNLAKMKLAPGYDRKRKAIIAIGTAEVLIKDPANDNTFMAVRAAKANEAYLNAKAEVIRSINTDFSAMDRVLTTAEFGEDDVQKAFAERRADFEAKREELAKKLAQLDKAEASAFRGVTMTDRFGAVIEGVAKKLDDKFNSAEIAAQKKAVRDQLKAECAELLAEYKVLEEEAKKIPAVPSTEVSSSVKMLSKMPLLGSSVLTQAESWDKTEKIYSVSIAVVWSPKLQENAVALVTGEAVPSSKKGQFTPQEWVAKQDLTTMIGPRRFTDNEGNNIFVGIATADLTGKVKDRKAKKMLADTAARKAVAFSLAGDFEAYREASSNYKEYDDDLRTSVEKLRDVVGQKCDINLQGCLPLCHKEVKHPITGRKTYVTAYYIEPALAKDAMDLLKKSYAGAIRQTKATQYRRGQHAGMEKSLDNQRKSTMEFSKGVADGARGVSQEVQRQQNEAKQQKKSVSAGASGSKRQEPTGQSQGGSFSGDATIDTDF
jgi:hypothetical protein